jgi:hypothetical protein
MPDDRFAPRALLLRPSIIVEITSSEAGYARN